MAEQENVEKTALNEYTIKLIKGTRYKICSTFAESGDFRQIYENLIAEKAARQQNSHCKDAANTI